MMACDCVYMCVCVIARECTLVRECSGYSSGTIYLAYSIFYI